MWMKYVSWWFESYRDAEIQFYHSGPSSHWTPSLCLSLMLLQEENQLCFNSLTWSRKKDFTEWNNPDSRTQSFVCISDHLDKIWFSFKVTPNVWRLHAQFQSKQLSVLVGLWPILLWLCSDMLLPPAAPAPPPPGFEASDRDPAGLSPAPDTSTFLGHRQHSSKQQRRAKQALVIKMFYLIRW